MRGTSTPRATTFVAVLALLVAFVAVPPAIAQVPTRVIDCDDQSGDDAESNAAGASETYSCLVTDGSGSPVNNAEIDAENLNGANDPDNSAAAGTADFDPACTTGTNGVCTFVLVPSENQGGVADVCFWVDTSDDDDFDPAAAAPAEDGGGCADEEASVEDSDGIDVVRKTWAGPVTPPAAIDCDDESGDDSQTNNVGESEVYTCLVTDSSGAGVSGVPIDWENLNGANDPDNSSSNATPDANNACTTNAQGRCTVAIASSEGQAGTAVICFWADHDADNVFDQNGAGNDGGGCNQESAATEDTDLIDTVSKTWTGVTASGLDCDDQSGNDAETNPAGQSETYICTVTAVDSADAGTERDPVTGVRIDWENLNGVNDPDNSSNNATPDGNDACTTAGTAGSCSVTIAPSENQSGTANICFWADTDGDNVFDQNGDANDGGGCNQESAATEDTDLIDVVEKTWSPSAAASVDVEPETGTNSVGTNHVITATVYDQAGIPLVGNTTVNFEFFNGSPNDTSSAGAADRTCTTSNTSTCSITITSTTAGTDLVCVWIGATPTLTGNNTNGQCSGEGLDDADDAAGSADAPSPATDRIDIVQKTWIQPVAAVSLTPAEATNAPGTQHVVTATVTNSAGNVVPGVTVAWSISGQGSFVAQEATTDAGGEAQAIITSTEVGNTVVTATASPCSTAQCSDTAVKHWGPADCTIFGTIGNDLLVGTSGSDVICGFGGDDTIRGFRGNDLLRGGAGNDIVRGGGDDDLVFGGPGDDVLFGGPGNDLLRGGSGNDRLAGGRGSDVLRGGSGGDVLQGGRGRDLLFGGRDADLCSGGPGRDRQRRC